MLNNRQLIFLLGSVAALHVFMFSAAFPFFSVVDEQAHFDLAVHYANAQPPRTLAKTSEEALPYLVYFNCSEFLNTPASQVNGHFAPPPWTVPPEVSAPRMAYFTKFWRETAQNHESSQPPIYYVIAGGFWRFGQFLGLPDPWRMYALRFLNALFLVALVWLGHRVARTIFPENQFVQVAVPAFVALFPQRVFYSINNDVLAPFTFGLAFFMVWKTCLANPLTPRLALGTGLALAAAFLTKISVLPLLAVAAVFLGGKALVTMRQTGREKSIPPLLLLFCAASLPMAAWMFWCQTNFGDFTGSAGKIHFLGWTNKPFVEWFSHPIFSASGFWFFVKGNLATFWQGEMLWHREPLAWPGLDVGYTLLTAALLFALLWFWWRRPATFSAPQRVALWFSFACVMAMFAFFALLSVKYDFHDCFYPSREKPFFVSGRLMLGMLIPFLLLLTAGLDQVLGKFSMRVKLSVLVALLALMLAMEFAVNWPVFSNEYNWYHL